MPKTFKFLIIDTYYPQFLSWLYRKFPEIAGMNYEEQKHFIIQQRFGTADFYSSNLKKLGCVAEEIISNNRFLQGQWAIEHGMKLEKSFSGKIANKIPFLRKRVDNYNDLLKVLESQIKIAKPDILYMQDISFCSSTFIQSMRKYVKLVIGQIACPLPDKKAFVPYDLILSSLPHYVEMFRSMGLSSELFKIGFENSILNSLNHGNRIYDVVHVGGYGPIHDERNQLLELVATGIRVNFWGYGINNLSPKSRILENYNGESWGIERYKIFAQSKIAITKHIAIVAGEYCNIMTLYEATGCGALLVTDYKKNLREIFVPDKEVVTYRSPDEAITKIKYYLEHEKERQEIADAGQERTLSEHSYYNRMVELIEIIGKYIKK
jgi:spore maturation protein CgeB